VFSNINSVLGFVKHHSMWLQPLAMFSRKSYIASIDQVNIRRRLLLLAYYLQTFSLWVTLHLLWTAAGGIIQDGCPYDHSISGSNALQE